MEIRPPAICILKSDPGSGQIVPVGVHAGNLGKHWGGGLTFEVHIPLERFHQLAMKRDDRILAVLGRGCPDAQKRACRRQVQVAELQQPQLLPAQSCPERSQVNDRPLAGNGKQAADLLAGECPPFSVLVSLGARFADRCQGVAGNPLLGAHPAEQTVGRRKKLVESFRRLACLRVAPRHERVGRDVPHGSPPAFKGKTLQPLLRRIDIHGRLLSDSEIGGKVSDMVSQIAVEGRPHGGRQREASGFPFPFADQLRQSLPGDFLVRDPQRHRSPAQFTGEPVTPGIVGGGNGLSVDPSAWFEDVHDGSGGLGLLTFEEAFQFRPEDSGEAPEFDDGKITVGNVALKLSDAAFAEVRRFLKRENGIRHKQAELTFWRCRRAGQIFAPRSTRRQQNRPGCGAVVFV